MIGTFLLLAAAAGTAPVDRDEDTYWECNHSLSDPGAGHFRGSISAIVDLEGRVRWSNFRYIDRSSHLHFKPVEGIPSGQYRLNYIYGGNIKLPRAPDQPLWLFHYADDVLIKQEINYTREHVRRGETRADAFVGSIRGASAEVLEKSEYWTVQAVLQDGTVVAHITRKSVSWADIRADQNVLKDWARRAASDPKKYCWYSSPESRWERDLSVIN